MTPTDRKLQSMLRAAISLGDRPGVVADLNREIMLRQHRAIMALFEGQPGPTTKQLPIED